MYFVAMFECSSLFILMHLDGFVLFIADRCHICFACLFQTVHPIPMIFISISTEINYSLEWHSWISKFRPGSIIPFQIMHMHRISHPAYHTLFASCCLCIARGWLFSLCLCFLLWVEKGDKFVNEEPVEYAYEEQAFDNSENLAGKMTTPRNHFYLCYASCLLYFHARYLSLAISCLLFQPCQPLTILS